MEILRKPAFDWLTFSDDKMLWDFSDSELNIRSKVLDKGNGVKNWVEKSGFDDRGVYDNLLKLCKLENVSRIDTCLDVNLASWEDISDFVPFVKRLKHKKTLQSFGSGGGRTFYFGSNDLILRIYEKGGQLNKPDDDFLKNWVRFEFQLKGRLAREYILSSQNPVDIFTTLSSKYLDIDFGQLGDIVDTLKQKDFEEQSCYYEKQVKPWIKKELQRNPQFIEQILSDLDTFTAFDLK